jgi:hypothetical protein
LARLAVRKLAGKQRAAPAAALVSSTMNAPAAQVTGRNVRRTDALSMQIVLDHATVPSRDSKAAADLLAFLLGVSTGKSKAGPFYAVYVSDSLTLDFDQSEGPFPVQHYCFRVSDAEFDAVLARLSSRRIKHRSTPHGEADMKVNTEHGGRITYWNEPDGHVWEILTVSYARQKDDA